jgi:RNA polymerase sigma-70 factor (ECF subfamily)
MSLEDRDIELVGRCQKGDLEAFALLVEKYKKSVYNLALRMVNNREDAADISQETFLRVYRHMAGFSKDHKFSTWLYSIASHLCIDRLRKLRGNVIELSYDIPDNSPLPEEQVILNQLREDIDKAVNNLPEKYRLVVVLRHVNELSYEEISSILKIPVSNVKTHLFRGREMLRSILSEVKAGDKNE